MSTPLSRSKSKNDSLVSSSESLSESSDYETTKEAEQSNSALIPAMKTKPASSLKQELNSASISTENSQSIKELRKESKPEITAPQQSSEEKKQWENFSKKINHQGILKLAGVNNEEIQALAKWLNTSYAGKVTGLQIQWNEGAMSDKDYKAAKTLASVIRTNTTITSLTISESDIDNKTADFFVEAIKSNSQSKITELSLNKNKITTGGAEALFEMLKTKTAINTLLLRNSYLGDEGTKALAKMLEINTTITTLDLSENKINAGGTQSLAKMLKINKTIKKLYIHENNIGDEGAKVLAEALKINPTITFLNISDNDIIGEGATALADMLKYNKTITTLYIQFNLFGTEGAKAFAETLKTNTTITTLYIVDAYFSGDGLTYIKMIEQQSALNAQREQIANNIAGALDVLTAHSNPLDGNETSLPEVNDVIAQKLFALDKANKLNTDEVKRNPDSVFNKYT